MTLCPHQHFPKGAYHWVYQSRFLVIHGWQVRLRGSWPTPLCSWFRLRDKVQTTTWWAVYPALYSMSYVPSHPATALPQFPPTPQALRLEVFPLALYGTHSPSCNPLKPPKISPALFSAPSLHLPINHSAPLYSLLGLYPSRSPQAPFFSSSLTLWQTPPLYN